MTARIFRGSTTHRRHRPTTHGFTYPMFWADLDVDDLKSYGRLLSVDRAGLMSIRTADYGGPGAGTIRRRIMQRLSEQGFTEQPASIRLVTIPRVFGYVFNPVSFYICSNNDDVVTALVAEVRNTFGEMHHYIAAPNTAEANRFSFAKAFYVSPFFDVDGEYELTLDDNNPFSLQIHLRKDNAIVFSAGMRGQGRPITRRALLGTLLTMPFFAATIMWRIHWQAWRLRRRGVALYHKPDPTSPHTAAAPRLSLWHRWRTALVNRHADSPAPSMTEGETT